MRRTEKEEMVAELSGIFNSAQVGFLVDYRGLNVAEVTEFRRRLKENATEFRVLKNRLAKIAIKNSPFEPLLDELSEPRGLVYGEEVIAPAKVVTKYMVENSKLEFISGVLINRSGASVLDQAQLKLLSNLPSREQLLTQVVFLLQAAPTALVRTLNEIPAKFVRTLAAVAAAKEQSAA